MPYLPKYSDAPGRGQFKPGGFINPYIYVPTWMRHGKKPSDTESMIRLAQLFKRRKARAAALAAKARKRRAMILKEKAWLRRYGRQAFGKRKR